MKANLPEYFLGCDPVLCFDTSGDSVVVALGRLGGVYTEGSLPTEYKKLASEYASPTLIAGIEISARRAANCTLMPAIDDLLEREGIARSNLSAVVVGRGPGSFTGVRIAMATAKGIACALGVPLYGVSTLDAIAHGAWLVGVRGKVGVVADAMRGEVYPVRFILNDEGVARLDSYTVAKAVDTVARWQSEESLVLLGDGLYKFRDAFDGFEILPEAFWSVNAAGLLNTFAFACAAGEQGSGDVSALLPIYTRLSDAEENERKRLAAHSTNASDANVAKENERNSLATHPVPTSGVRGEEEDVVVYRPLPVADVSLVAHLEEVAFSYPQGAWSEEMIREGLTQENRFCWAAYGAGELLGYVLGDVIDATLFILRLAVAPQVRRKGIGTSLIAHLAKDAEALAATEISLEVRASNTVAQELYKSLGMQEVGRRRRYYVAKDGSRETAAREDAISMKGALPLAVRRGGSNGGESGVAFDSAPARTASSTSAPHPRILAIETSCDETAAAVVAGDGCVLTNCIASQVHYHSRFGGVVPEIASRKHTESILPIVQEALNTAQLTLNDLDAIAVTYAPGLIGALVVGVAFAKGLAWASRLPLIFVNHLEGHIYANKLACTHQSLAPPFVAALLSGGTTMLVHVRDWGDYRVMGQTLDDAAGEAFDKVAKALNLGYPGGPIISRFASAGDAQAIEFPRALLHSKTYDFSLSGLKTAVITWIREQEAAGATINLPDVAASFQQAVIDVQVAKALAACCETGVKLFCVGGGVAANSALRAAYETTLGVHGIEVCTPPLEFCTDNAAMIGLVALDSYACGVYATLADDALANVSLE